MMQRSVACVGLLLQNAWGYVQDFSGQRTCSTIKCYID